MILLSIILFICIFLLNTTTKLLLCSLAFVSSALVANIITKLYGRTNAFNILVVCIAINIAIVWKSLNFMLLSSFVSLFISLYISINLIEELKLVFRFEGKNLIGLAFCSLVDSSIIAASLLSKVGFNRALIIGLKDLAFKLSYTVLITVCLLIVLNYLLCQIHRNYSRASKLIDFIVRH